MWVLIPNYPDYEINEGGTIRLSVRTFTRGRPAGYVIKPRISNSGYLFVELCPKDTRRGFFVHTLVAMAFIGMAPSEEHQVAHNDGGKFNNHWSNLRWALPIDNHADKKEHGTYLSGESVPNAKLTEAVVAKIRAEYATGRVSQKSIAKDYGISQSAISKIITGLTWAATNHDLPTSH